MTYEVRSSESSCRRDDETNHFPDLVQHKAVTLHHDASEFHSMMKKRLRAKDFKDVSLRAPVSRQFAISEVVEVVRSSVERKEPVDEMEVLSR